MTSPPDAQPRPALRLLHAADRRVRPSGDLRLRGQHHQAGRHQRHFASRLPFPIATTSRHGSASRSCRFGGTRFVTRGGYGLFYDKENWNTHQGLNNQPLFRTSRQYQRPGSISQAFSGAAGRFRCRTSTRARLDFRDAYYHQWNVFVEGEPISDFTVGIGYVGSKGGSLPLTRDINQPTPGTGAVQTRRPIQQYGPISYRYLRHLIDLSLAPGAGRAAIPSRLVVPDELHAVRRRSIRCRFTAGRPRMPTTSTPRADRPIPTRATAFRRASITSCRWARAAPSSQMRSGLQGGARRRLAGQRHRLAGLWRAVHAVRLAGRRRHGTARQPVAGSNLQRRGRQPDTRTLVRRELLQGGGAGHVRQRRPQHARRPGPRDCRLVDLQAVRHSRPTIGCSSAPRSSTLFNHANFAQPNATIDAPLTVGRISTTVDRLTADPARVEVSVLDPEFTCVDQNS